MSRDFFLLPIIPPRRTGETSIPFWYWDTGRNLFLSAHYFLFQPRREIANSVSSRGLDHLVVLLSLKGKQKEETSCLQSVSLLPALWVGKNCSLLEGPLRQGPRLEDPWLQYICLRKFACSHVDSLQPPWPVAHQTPLYMGFFRQECWSGLPCPPPGDLPVPRTEPKSPVSPVLEANSLWPPGKPVRNFTLN